MCILRENKFKVVDLIIRNGFNITHVIYNDIKNDIEYELTYDEIMDRVKDAEWTFLKGGIHLKLNGKSLFHFQREGKKNDLIVTMYYGISTETYFYVTVKLVSHTPYNRGFFYAIL